ncbi:hypothetical protein ABB37_09471 [Leptomonas pyrrhocoris]|uniref:Uncharacterized protein n=1 Tax=Leptomonas pyrrhocoris TaxID=157538 RepID=A0A0M9FQB6_LEPPY|nr:hypothetical protein ABB37_09471 [Leptomonas pyrrhocoris]KPA73827.1 hypothetical protein ABB37_09471 [Leptomonas pyrrhocoris]|eukprot:XP_015652266.1 hypothetical protein ABB37_09471 [Leptomonas pyrrhocoris]
MTNCNVHAACRASFASLHGLFCGYVRSALWWKVDDAGLVTRCVLDKALRRRTAADFGETTGLLHVAYGAFRHFKLDTRDITNDE